MSSTPAPALPSASVLPEPFAWPGCLCQVWLVGGCCEAPTRSYSVLMGAPGWSQPFPAWGCSVYWDPIPYPVLVMGVRGWTGVRYHGLSQTFLHSLCRKNPISCPQVTQEPICPPSPHNPAPCPLSPVDPAGTWSMKVDLSRTWWTSPCVPLSVKWVPARQPQVVARWQQPVRPW